MVAGQRGSPYCGGKVGEISIEQVTKSNCLSSFLTEDGLCKMKVRRQMGIAKNTFIKPGKIPSSGKILMHTKKRALDC